MRTMDDMELRQGKISERLSDILDELRASSDAPHRAIELAEEIALLLREATIINTNMRYHSAVTKALLTDPCSGPH